MELIFEGHSDNCFPKRLVGLLRLVEYKPDTRLLLKFLNVQTSLVRIWPSIPTLDANTQRPFHLRGYGFNWDPSITIRGLTQGLFAVIRKTEEHECAEQFTLNEVRVFDPHVDTLEQEERLLEVCSILHSYKDKDLPLEIQKARMNSYS